MKHSFCTAGVLLLLLVSGALTLSPAHAQIPGLPTGQFPATDMLNMTDEQRQDMLNEMMLQFSDQIGIDPEAFRNATKDEQREMLDEAGEAWSNQQVQQFNDKIGMSAEQFNQPSEAEQGAVFFGRSQAPVPSFEPLPLPVASPRGFPDGSVPLPTATDYTTELVVSEPSGQEMLLVVADISRREIVWRETRTAPFQERLDLLELAPSPSSLVIELIDPDTHRVIRRYRPVAAAVE